MRKQIAAILVFVMFLLTFAGCSTQYHAETFIGKTSAQIAAEYGDFDCCEMLASADGLYRNTACGYTIEETQVGFLGTEPEKLFFITFDENGIAVACEEGYRPGG